MDRRTYWLSAGLLAAALLFHAVFPRYDVTVRDQAVFRVDRWTGHLDVAGANGLRQAGWVTVVEPARTANVSDIVGSEPAR